jgi:hypothetical protein
MDNILRDDKQKQNKNIFLKKFYRFWNHFTNSFRFFCTSGKKKKEQI